MRNLIIAMFALTLSAQFAHAEQDSADLARSVFRQTINTSSGGTSNMSGTAGMNTQPTNASGTITDTSGPAGDPNRYNNYSGTGAGTVNNLNNSTGSTKKAPDGSTINNGAETGAASQGSGSMINAAVGAALMAACMAPCPKCNMPLCAMGAMAFMQAGHDSGAAGESNAVVDITNPTGKPGTNTNPNGTGGFDDSAYKEGVAKLNENGYTVTDKGVKFPDGSLKTSSDFSSPAAMTAAGMDPAAVRDASAVLSAINQEVNALNKGKVSAVGLNTGGGGGGYDEGGGGGSGDASGGAGGLGGFGGDSDMQKKLVAGKTVMFDGEPIGVSGQNIFDMIHDAYQKRRKGAHFIESEGPPMRAPASAPKRR